MSETIKYCFSTDGETYTGEFETREEALVEAKETYNGNVDKAVWTAEILPLKWADLIDGEQILTNIMDAAIDQVGEFGQDIYDNLDENELSGEIMQAINKILVERSGELTCFQVQNIQKHTI